MTLARLIEAVERGEYHRKDGPALTTEVTPRRATAITKKEKT